MANEVEHVEEEVQTEEVAEEVKEDPVVNLQSQQDKLKTEMDKLEERNKMLSSELTRNQQENAEFVRLFKSRMNEFEPKQFNESWEESPERAVKEVSDRNVQPLQASVDKLEDEQKRLQANLWVSELLADNPSWRQYETVVRGEYGSKKPEYTTTKEGIGDLFTLAEARDPERKKAMANERADHQKARAVTEGSTGREPEPGTPRLKSDEIRVAKRLRMSEKDYYAYKNRGGERGRPKDWKSQHTIARGK